METDDERERQRKKPRKNVWSDEEGEFLLESF
jgi:hypothetical protein